MSKFNLFIEALQKLCIEHKVVVSTSGYDCLQVWDLECEGDLLRQIDSIEDQTSNNSG